MLLMYRFEKQVSAVEKIGGVAALSLYAYFLIQDQFVTPQMWDIVTNSINLLQCGSKIPQIISNFRNKSTGQLAFLTFLMAFGGAAARLFTVIVETNDMSYMVMMILSTSLNGILFLQFFCYWNAPAKVDKDKKDK
eukprot:CAMPEP_0202956394 /NCGR_PEP_ID=MMETSP1396-20130829/906_1 /ASSEMBLY_ACC=CAM_ASM_000872 /TAXON_ID= /ORGANISM="Pseudokeronopsis sp., Strain Brazil" /LENGTH=135 /DNA_ID=CAMNT_0049673389 /DNA_START=392 /DNA_END=799 /DNA_ORIENTATION=+